MDDYINCISALATRVRRIGVARKLSALQEFYVQPQTGMTETQIDMTRRGILILLDSIQDTKGYDILLKIHKELIKVYIKLEIDAIQEGPYTFFYFIFKSPDHAIAVLYYTYEIFSCFGENTHKVLQYLFRLKLRVLALAGERVPQPQFMNFFLKRAGHFINGFKSIKSQINSNMRLKMIQPTDGDMHCGGKIPYYVLSDDGRKRVYKPRNMKIDFLITQAVAYFNTFLEERFQLPIIPIDLFDNTGFMDFVTHTEEMTQEQADAYFVKFGVLICIIKLFGIEDLHEENIIATLQGPVMVDLEVALNPVFMKSEDIVSDPFSRIKECFNERKMDNAIFTVDKKFYPLNNWSNQILEGFCRAVRCCIEHKSDLITHYQTFFQDIFYIRVVPVTTAEFCANMYNAIYMGESYIQESCGGTCNMIVDYFVRNFHVSEGLFDKEVLFSRIYNDLFYGDIPLIQLGIHVMDGEVHYIPCVDSKFLSETIRVPFSTLLTEFGNQIDWLSSKTAMDAIANFIG